MTVSGRSGLTKAYTSVLSAVGSLEICGASRCDDMVTPYGGLAGGSDQVLHEGRVTVGDLSFAEVEADVAGRGVGDVGDDRTAEPERSDSAPLAAPDAAGASLEAQPASPESPGTDAMTPRVAAPRVPLRRNDRRLSGFPIRGQCSRPG